MLFFVLALVTSQLGFSQDTADMLKANGGTVRPVYMKNKWYGVLYLPGHTHDLESSKNDAIWDGFFRQNLVTALKTDPTAYALAQKASTNRKIGVGVAIVSGIVSSFLSLKEKQLGSAVATLSGSLVGSYFIWQSDNQFYKAVELHNRGLR